MELLKNGKASSHGILLKTFALTDVSNTICESWETLKEKYSILLTTPIDNITEATNFELATSLFTDLSLVEITTTMPLHTFIELFIKMYSSYIKEVSSNFHLFHMMNQFLMNIPDSLVLINTINPLIESIKKELSIKDNNMVKCIFVQSLVIIASYSENSKDINTLDEIHKILINELSSLLEDMVSDSNLIEINWDNMKWIYNKENKWILTMNNSIFLCFRSLETEKPPFLLHYLILYYLNKISKILIKLNSFRHQEETLKILSHILLKNSSRCSDKSIKNNNLEILNVSLFATKFIIKIDRKSVV